MNKTEGEASGISPEKHVDKKHVEISYDNGEDTAERTTWNNSDPNRRVTIRQRAWMIKGTVNRILKNGLFKSQGDGVEPGNDIFRKTNAGPDIRLNLRTTTKADDEQFKAEVWGHVQEIIKNGPQNPEYLNDDESEKRKQYNLGVDGAVIRALKLLPPHIKDPNMVKLPEDFFRNGDSDVFKARVLAGLYEALMEAKKDHPTRLEIAAFTINEQIQNHPTINKLREELGEDVFDLTELFQWTVQICKGEIPTRITEEYMFYIFEQALVLAEIIYTDITDKKRANEIEDGFKEAMLEKSEEKDQKNLSSESLKRQHERRKEILKELSDGDMDKQRLESLKTELRELRNELLQKNFYELKGMGSKSDLTELRELEGTEFVKALYKKAGIHLGFQGLQSNRELAPVAKQYDDLARIFKYLMGWDKRRGTPDPNRKRSVWDSKREMRTKDYIEPSLLIAFDENFFAGMDREEQLKRLKTLQLMLGKEYLDSLGVIKALELAGRTATLDGKGHEGRKKAELLCNKRIRLTLGSDHSNADYYTIKYETLKGFYGRKITYFIDDGKTDPSGTGLALGRIIPLNTRSDTPLGMEE